MRLFLDFTPAAKVALSKGAFNLFTFADIKELLISASQRVNADELKSGSPMKKGAVPVRITLTGLRVLARLAVERGVVSHRFVKQARIAKIRAKQEWRSKRLRGHFTKDSRGRLSFRVGKTIYTVDDSARHATIPSVNVEYAFTRNAVVYTSDDGSFSIITVTIIGEAVSQRSFARRERKGMLKGLEIVLEQAA